jgi:hypothetical protein
MKGYGRGLFDYTVVKIHYIYQYTAAACRFYCKSVFASTLRDTGLYYPRSEQFMPVQITHPHVYAWKLLNLFSICLHCTVRGHNERVWARKGFLDINGVRVGRCPGYETVFMFHIKNDELIGQICFCLS